MTWKCYFCQTEKLTDSLTESCRQCKDTHGLEVYTTPDKNDFVYAHIYVWRHERQYHFRLHLNEGFTYLGASAGGHVIDLPGFPITPANATEKLITYLVFL